MRDFIIFIVVCISIVYFSASVAIFFTGIGESCKSNSYSRLVTYTGLTYFHKAGCYMGEKV